MAPSLAIAPSGVFYVLVLLYFTGRRDAAKPEHVDIGGVRDWKGWFAPEIARLGLSRFACSYDSGEGVYQLLLRKGSNGTVELTYKRRSPEVEVYPKPFQIGERVLGGALGPGVVMRMDYEIESAFWSAVITHDNGQTSVERKPVSPILIFSGGLPENSPTYETMDQSFKVDYPKCKRNILKCLTDLPLVRDTPGAAKEWAQYFEVTDASFERCKADPAQSWYEGATPQLPQPGLHGDLGVFHAPPPPTPPFAVDPITFNTQGGVPGFLESQRIRLIAAAAARKALAAGDLVALRLLRGTASSAAPQSHTAPFCLGRVPIGFEGAELVPFVAFYSTTRDATAGYWYNGGVLAVPLSAIICGGLELESLNAHLDPTKMTVVELKEEIIARGDSPSGSKPSLVTRLNELISSSASDVPACKGVTLTKSAVTQLRNAASDWELGRI